jgi:hypothetical protein
MAQETVAPSKHVICINVSNRLMLWAQDVVERQPDAHLYKLVHEVHATGHKYVAVLYYAYGEKHGFVSHTFDIQMMLDLREGAEQHIRAKLVTLVAQLRETAE